MIVAVRAPFFVIAFVLAAVLPSLYPAIQKGSDQIGLAAEADKFGSQDGLPHLARREVLVAKVDLHTAFGESEAARDQSPEMVKIHGAPFRVCTAVGRSEVAAMEKEGTEKLTPP
jgi:hypothetical protein